MGALVTPGDLLLFILVVGSLLLLVGSYRAGRRWVLVGTIGFLAVALLPVDRLLIAPLEDRFPVAPELPDHIDGIIVLGGAVVVARDRPAMNDAGERVLETAILALRHPEAKVVASGGSEPQGSRQLVEADATAEILTRLGVDPSRIIRERESRNTVENAVLSQKLANPQPGETWVLVTSAAHMPRSVGIFRHLGWPVIPWPTGYKSGGDYEPDLPAHLQVTGTALHEWVGLVSYRLLGRTGVFLPGP